MFEKEAEEYRKEKLKEQKDKFVFELPEVYIADIKQTYLDGAEFGYNKANEWHNPKEKLPTKDCEVLIEYNEHKIHRVVDWNNKSKHFSGFSIDEVTRWKEIK